MIGFRLAHGYPRRFRNALPLAVAICSCGCAIFHHEKPPPAPPTLSQSASSFVGSPLSGPTTAPAPDVSPDDAMRVDVEWIALQKMPGEGLLPLDTQSRLTVATLAPTPVLTTGQVSRLVRFGSGDTADSFLGRLQAGQLGPMIRVTNQSGLLVPGATLRFQSAAPSNAVDSVRHVTLSLSKTPGDTSTTRSISGTLAIGMEGIIHEPSGGDAEDSGRSRSSASASQETAFLNDLPMDDRAHFVLLAPCKFDGTIWNALVADVHVRRLGNDAAGLAAIQQLHKELTDASNRARAAGSTTRPGEQPTLESAINALSRSSNLRPPLLFLTTATGATIAADFVLVADNALLGRLRDETVRFSASQSQSLTPEGLEWFLDRTVLLLMAEQAKKNSLSPELASVLTLHTGQVGRNPDSVEDVVKSVGNAHDLKMRLIGENYIELEDNFPGARVRAFDWLKAQGKAPAGFDPLGDARARRAAIEHALESPRGAQ